MSSESFTDSNRAPHSGTLLRRCWGAGKHPGCHSPSQDPSPHRGAQPGLAVPAAASTGKGPGDPREERGWSALSEQLQPQACDPWLLGWHLSWSLTGGHMTRPTAGGAPVLQSRCRELREGGRVPRALWAGLSEVGTLLLTPGPRL